jgi:hypothetical protein
MSDFNADKRAFFQEAFFSNCRVSRPKPDEKPTTTQPQENVQEVEEPYGRSYYLSWSLSRPTLSPQNTIKEKANSISSLKKLVSWPTLPTIYCPR